jgi:hypothetical protein
LDVSSVKNTEYNTIHRLICNHFRDEINSRDDFFLAPFSLKKGANIYGIIFGSSSLSFLKDLPQVRQMKSSKSYSKQKLTRRLMRKMAKPE